MKIYTKTGDKGETSLVSGKRVSKAHPLVDCYGDVDELNSTLGLVTAQLNNETFKESLFKVQNQLFNLGSNLACDNEDIRKKLPQISEKHIHWLEKEIDQHQSQLPELKNFILPGGHIAAAACQLSRSVCRRAERKLIEISQSENIPSQYIEYLNRLSDYLFVMARAINHYNNITEPQWQKED
ncbi:MAG: cob(I)yrinic acid a,c-diamide adenosyltransferase [Bdellovibrionales bacterium]|nr:cob(I)yrinic acid a,c-diamide adenosyltransferase [Bdellovibrionales bacterium]